MATIPDRGDLPNYERITEAMAAHRATWDQIDALALMYDRAGDGKCFVMVEGCDSAPLEVTTQQARALINTAMQTKAADALELGLQLNEFASELPSTRA